MFGKVLIVGLVLISGVAAVRQHGRNKKGPLGPYNAVVSLSGSSNVKGLLNLTQSGIGAPLFVKGTINGLAPNTQHGFHFHQNGDLSDGCTSALSHFNPSKKPQIHGDRTAQVRHAGDEGNLISDASGTIYVNFSDSYAQLIGPFSVVGRMAVIHEKIDDLGKGNNEASKENGNAGARLACGVIGIVEK